MPALSEYWSLVLQSIKKEVVSSNYNAWFSTIKFKKIENNGRKIVLEVPSSFNKKYLESKFKKKVQKAVQKYYPQVIHIEYLINSKLNSQTSGLNSSLQKKSKDLGLDNLPAEVKLIKPSLNKNLNHLNPKYTFDNFVTTRSNEFAVQVAKAVIDRPGKLYNPVFIYSSVGLGKTHLLQAIGQQIVEEKPGLKVKYSTSETFFNLFINSIQKKSSNEFKEFYRSLDVLLLDDIQFIAGKEATQEAFFHTFNELHQNNKQIIITSDKPPKSLVNLEERLVSRFEWGIVVDISKPELEDRITVLKDKIERMRLNINLEMITRIAEAVNTNFRDLEGVLNRIEARQKLLPGRPFADYELEKILSGFKISSPIKIDISYRPNTPDRVMEVTSQVYGINLKNLKSKSKIQNIAEARQVAMYLCKEDLGLSFPAVGKCFSRDHTTILHAYKKITAKLKTDLNLRGKIDSIKSILNQ